LIKKRFDPDTHYLYAALSRHRPVNTDHIRQKFVDVPYSALSPANKLDIYLPECQMGPYSVILSIHGGGFMGGDKSDSQDLAPALEGLKRGYAVVAVNYRLSWEAVFPAMVQDVKAAVRWVRANAGKYNFDLKRIAAWGGSAGGYLSAMLGTSAGISELEDLSLGNPDQPCNVQAVVVWYGPTDFLKMDEQLAESGMLPPPGFRHSEANSPESLLLGQLITEIPDKVRVANPETYINNGVPPFLLQHGVRDQVVPVQQSIELAAKLKRFPGKDRVVELDLIDGAEHTDPKFGTPENVKRVLDFLDKYLKQN
jgi:acetyl esterase/lipase